MKKTGLKLNKMLGSNITMNLIQFIGIIHFLDTSTVQIVSKQLRSKNRKIRVLILPN